MKRAFFAAGLILLLVTSAWAQKARPNFSGTWNLDVAKSDFGPAPPPDSMVAVIEHKDPSLKMSTTQKGLEGEFTNERSLTTDGKENTNRVRTVVGEQEVKSTTSWNGRKLAIAFTLDVQGTVLDINDSWELSDDGKVMIVLRNMKSAQGDLAQKIVFNKQ